MRPGTRARHAHDLQEMAVGSRTAITVNRPEDEVRRMWQDPTFRPEYIGEVDAEVTFRYAPGDRGTEVHVALQREAPRNKIGEIVQKAARAASLAKVKDDLRRFKLLVETG